MDRGEGDRRGDGGHPTRLARLVEAFVAAREGGATCEEVELVMHLRHQTASARIRELVLLGKLVDSGTTRRNQSGRPAVVWVAVLKEVSYGASA